MRNSSVRALILIPALLLVGRRAQAQVDLPPSAMTAGRDTAPTVVAPQAPLVLSADLDAHILRVQRGDSLLKTYTFASGRDRYPTPEGTFQIRKIVWNPSWRPPPESDWAKGKTAKGPGDPGNPMKVVKIFFKEPDYYIHGTDDPDSIGAAASHGCLRMEPLEAADLAIRVMEASGAKRDSTWYQNAIDRGETRTVRLPRKVEMLITA